MIKMGKVLKGNWAHVRLSWATHFVELLNMLRDILHLADLARCRVYDGHIQDYVTSDNLKSVRECFEKGAKWVGSPSG